MDQVVITSGTENDDQNVTTRVADCEEWGEEEEEWPEGWEEDELLEQEADYQQFVYYSQLGLRVPPLASGLVLKPINRLSTTSKPKKVNQISPKSCETDKTEIDEPFLILPGLFLGSETHAKCEKTLLRLGITHVVGIHEKSKRHFPNSFDYLIIHLKDKESSEIGKHFVEVNQFISKAHSNGGSVLVHCWAGVSRSATLVTAYLMQLEHISMRTALSRVEACKPDVEPNKGFIRQLKAYERQLAR